MDKELDLTTGVIWKQLLLFFFPILIGTFFQQLYNTVDTVIVGKYVGTNALAAVGSTGNLINLIVNFFIGLSSGATVVIAQFYGSNDDIKVSKAVHTSIAMSFICGVVMMIFGLLFSRQCLNMIGVPSDIINDATAYMKLYFLSMIPGVIYNIGAGILRAIGDSKTPLYYLIICSGVNVFFDLLFVAYFKIGVAGAAIATVIAQFVCAILVMRKLMKSKHSYQLRLKEIKIDAAILKRIIKIGIPAGIQSTMYSISNIVLQTSINVYGTNTIASWAAYVKIDALFWMVMGAFGSTITTFTGQNYGAGLMKRVNQGMKTCLFMAFVSAGLISSFLWVFGSNITVLFSNDIKIINECSEIIRFLTPFYFTYCCVEIFSGIMRGCGNSLEPMIIVCLGICVLRIFWVLFIAPIFSSFNMLLVSYPITWSVTSILFLFVYHRFRIKKL